MKKFNFSLQKILEIKEQILNNFKIELNSLNLSLKNVDEAIKGLKYSFYEKDNEFIKKSSSSISVGELAYYKMVLSSILKQIEHREEEKQIVLKKLEVKRQEIVNINIEISSIKKLKEKEMDQYKKSILKGEEIFIEEFVSNKSISKEYVM